MRQQRVEEAKFALEQAQRLADNRKEEGEAEADAKRVEEEARRAEEERQRNRTA